MDCSLVVIIALCRKNWKLSTQEVTQILVKHLEVLSCVLMVSENGFALRHIRYPRNRPSRRKACVFSQIVNRWLIRIHRSTVILFSPPHLSHLFFNVRWSVSFHRACQEVLVVPAHVASHAGAPLQLWAPFKRGYVEELGLCKGKSQRGLLSICGWSFWRRRIPSLVLCRHAVILWLFVYFFHSIRSVTVKGIARSIWLLQVLYERKSWSWTFGAGVKFPQ